MAKSTTQIQAESDTRRGIKPKTFKLNIDTIAQIEKLSKEYGIPQNTLITQAIQLLEEQLKQQK